MEARIFDIKHRLITTEKFRIQLPIDELISIILTAGKELHWSLAKSNVLKGEFTFATYRTYRCSGEVIFIKIESLSIDENLGELCQLSMLSRPRRSFTMFDMKKNYLNILQLSEYINEYVYLEDEEVLPTEGLDN